MLFIPVHLPKELWNVMAKSDDAQLDPAQWLERYGDFLFQYAWKRLRSQEAAEEVVQDTFFAAWRQRKQYAGSGTERAWLVGILKRKIIDTFRARQRQPNLDSAADRSDIFDQLFDARGHWKVRRKALSPLPSDAAEIAELWEAFYRCLDALPQRQADVFTLRELEFVESHEICKELGVTPSNLWVLLHRARLALANCLKTKL